MSQQKPGEAWQVGDGYESFVGRWSRVVAREFVTWLNVPSGSRWLDIGCGTGAVSEAILSLANPREVRGIDASQEFLDYARARIDDVRAAFGIGDALALPAETGSYDAAVSGLALNFFPDQEQAVREMARVVRSAGIVAAYVWDYADGMQMTRLFWDAAVALDPAAVELDQRHRFPICQPGPLRDLFTAAGLVGVEVIPIDIPTVFHNFDDFWVPFTGGVPFTTRGQGAAPRYCKSLDAPRLARLREHLRKSLPIAADGSIALIGRAWAVRAARP